MIRFGGGLRSVGMPLSELFDNPKLILKKLAECHSVAGSNFRIIFYNSAHSSLEIKKLFKDISDLISSLNITVTKDLRESSFFRINYDSDDEEPYRYGYIGGVVQGLDVFVQLIKHVNKRVQEGYR